MCSAPSRNEPAASSRLMTVEVVGAMKPSRTLEPQPAGLPAE